MLLLSLVLLSCHLGLIVVLVNLRPPRGVLCDPHLLPVLVLLSNFLGHLCLAIATESPKLPVAKVFAADEPSPLYLRRHLPQLPHAFKNLFCHFLGVASPPVALATAAITTIQSLSAFLPSLSFSLCHITLHLSPSALVSVHVVALSMPSGTP